jgi:hypothetical protein
MLPNPVQRDLVQFDRALRAQGESPRFWRINRLESWYLGEQYAGRPSFWSTEVPLRERAPVVQSQYVRSAVQRLATLVFGDRSFPRLKVEAEGFRVTLSPTERDGLQALVDELVRALALSKRMREVISEGLKSGSACVVVGLVEGRPTLSILPAKWCTPTLRADGSVEALAVEYKCPHPTDEKRWMAYRREITAQYDRTYEPVEVRDKEPLAWGAFTDIPLEFCPVVWIRNDAEATATVDQVDGHALVEGLEDEVEALDMELSQLYRNALYNGEPQLVQIGVDEGPLAGPVGQTSTADTRFSWLNSVLPGWAQRGGSSESALKKAPGKLWKLPSGGDAKMVESTGAGAEIIRGAVKELRRVLTDASGVVLFDADALGTGDISGRALTLLHAPMLDHADNLRVEYGDALVRIVNLMLRLLASERVHAEGALLRTYDAAFPVLSRFEGVSVEGSRKWIPVAVSLQWGEYFEPSAQDRQAAVATAMAASGGQPVLSHRSAVAAVAALFGLQDVDAEVDATSTEHAASQQSAAEALARFGGMAPVDAEDGDDQAGR